MHIEFLDRHPGLVPTLAAWHHGEWGHLYSYWTLEVATRELAGHATRRSLPTTLVMVEQGAALGSVSLVLEDSPELSEHGSPWLASLFVRPESRGRGLGAQLVHAAVSHAATLGVDELFLFTPQHAGFYAQLGWRPLARTALLGTPVDLMCIAPRAAEHAAA